VETKSGGGWRKPCDEVNLSGPRGNAVECAQLFLVAQTSKHTIFTPRLEQDGGEQLVLSDSETAETAFVGLVGNRPPMAVSRQLVPRTGTRFPNEGNGGPHAAARAWVAVA
jgi:hypothetical protein